jgi:23S rRNA (uracil1939-C5)-methyltransferase
MIQGTIDTIAFGGQGILRHEGLVIFVPFTAPGDHVDINIVRKKKQHAFAELISIRHPSSMRTPPKCPYFGTCGGCQFQHLTYAAQLEVKRRFIEDALQRIGKLNLTVPPVVPAERTWSYRRHIRLSVRNGAVGYIGTDKHSCIPVEQCPIFTEQHDPILIQLAQFITTCALPNTAEISIKVLKQESNQFLPVFSFDTEIPPHVLTCAKQALNTHPNWAGVVLASPTTTHSIGATKCTASILGLSVTFSPFGFIQNHPEQSTKLYEAIMKAIPPEAKSILDLYCGIGITSLLLAQRGIPVVGIESHPDTVDMAKENARRQGMDRVKFLCGKAETLIQEVMRTLKPEAILCNPPRTGLDPSLVQTLLQLKPRTLVYVSCMPATLARDIRPFIEAGYHVDLIQGFDMFPQTTHVETLIKLQRT